MAEIEMERRPRRNTWIWVAAAVLVLVLAVGAWLLFARGTTGYDLVPGMDRPETTEPTTDPYHAPTEQNGGVRNGEVHGELLHPEPTDAAEAPEGSPTQ